MLWPSKSEDLDLNTFRRILGCYVRALIRVATETILFFPKKEQG